MKHHPVCGFVLLILLLATESVAVIYPVTSVADTSATGTLRWAINQANAGDADQITFNLPVPYKIAPTGELPSITDASTTIDGSSQPGFSGTPIVHLCGTGTPAGSDGLMVWGQGNVVRGLMITKFRIGVGAGGGITVAGCHIMSNTMHGINISASANNTIGGTHPTNRNVISANQQFGIQIWYPGSTNNKVLGNYIGTDASGTAAAGNVTGVYIGENASRNFVGGTAAGSRNLISGNNYGIFIEDTGTTANVIQGNYIGTDASGTAKVPNTQDGIQILSPSNTVGGTSAAAANLISGNGANGVSISGTNAFRNSVLGNDIGVDATGTGALGNTGSGVEIANAPSNTIGGTVSGAGNLIGGNATGIRVYGLYAVRNVIQGNGIGVDVSGTAAVSNRQWGIDLSSSRNTQVGGTNAASRNVISGNGAYAIDTDPEGGGHIIEGNYIGTDVTGSYVITNVSSGIRISAPGCRVGGTNAARRNVIAGCSVGIWVSGTNATNTVIYGNYIGTDSTGANGLGNRSYGIHVDGAAHHVFVGSTVAGCGNVISGNWNDGIHLSASSREVRVEGNYIGTDASGARAVANSGSGVYIAGPAVSNWIGGAGAGWRNVISGNSGHGITINDAGAQEIRIKGNHIGTGVMATNAVPNGVCGIWLGTGASNNFVGGMEVGAGNTIAFNREKGVAVYAGAGHVIMGNAIKRNGELGIDLGSDGVTANDIDDEDIGPNDRQNFPVILSVSNNSGNVLYISGVLNSRPSTNYYIELFGSRDPDLTGYGEGEEFFLNTRLSVTTDVSGTAVFTGMVIVAMVHTPNFITATATLSNRQYCSTSEFGPRFFLDSDGDGMGDGYEVEYFGGYTNGNPQGHADSDGMNNLEEFLAETDPTDRHSSLAFTQIRRESGNCYVTIGASDCREYGLQIAPELMNPLSWMDSYSSPARTTGQVTFIENASTYSTTLYRVVAEIP